MVLRDVNLVPEQVLHRRYVIRHVAAWSFAYLLLLGFSAGAYTVYTRGVLARRRPPTDEAQLRKRLATTIAEVQEKVFQVERLAFVRRMSRPGSMTLVLDRLAQDLDPQTWLTEFSLQTREGSGATLVLSGRSVSHAKLGTLIGQLTSDRMFGNVVLKTADEERGSTGSIDQPSDLIAFTIQGEVLGE